MMNKLKCNTCGFEGEFIILYVDCNSGSSSLIGRHPKIGHLGKVYLYSCPECDTVRMKIKGH